MKRTHQRMLAAAIAAPMMLLGAACSEADRQDARSDASRVANRAENSASDTVVTTKVKSALLADSQVKGTQVEVTTSDGVVTLSGSVATPEEKQRAEQVAKTIEGVRSVRNEVAVASR